MHHPWTHWPTAGLLALVALGGLLADPASASLVHRYTFENGADDAVGGLDGTANGATIDTGEFAEGAYSAKFMGYNYNEHIAFASTAFNPTAFSFAMWVKPSTVGRVQALLANKGGGTTAGFSMTLSNDDLLFEAVDDSNTGNSARANGVMSAGSWQHVCFAIDRAGDTCSIYHDGSPVTDDPDIQHEFVYDGAWRLGLLMDNGSDFWGRLDDVQIYDEVLSPGDVAFLAENPGAVIPEPVTTVGLLLGGAALTAYSRRRNA